MASNKKEEKFEKAVKPFYYPADECFIVYSPSEKLSSEAKFSALLPKDVKAKFGFELLCDNLSESVRNAEKFRFEEGALHPVPEGITSYLIENNSLYVFILHKTSSKMGFGISTYSALKKGIIIAEYIGEIKPLDIKLDDNSYVLLNNDGTKIDAKDYGNVARFFNHCPFEHADEQVLTANIMILPWQVSQTLTKVFFMTLRDIKEFEPLCWDYGDKYRFDNGVELLNAETYLPMNEFKDEF